MHSTQPHNPARSTRRLHLRKVFQAMFVLITVVAFVISTSSAALSQDVVRVEEEWELVLDVVSETKQSPQFETVMSPFSAGSELSDFFCRVSWNYRELPEYVPGGFQMQTWFGEDVYAKKDLDGFPFSTAGETISWTQQLEIGEDSMWFRIKNGQSTTWGPFGGSELEVVAVPQPTNLNYYSPEVSRSRSMITYGANRVLVLRIKEVRKYDQYGQLLSTDGTSHVVYQR